MLAYGDDTRTIYEIPAENMEKFEAQIAKLSKRAVKLGCDPIIPFAFDREDKKLSDGRVHRVYKVLFTADTPKLAGWTFAARLDHANETGNIIRAVPNTGLTVPEKFRTADSYCEHCRVKRYRRDTFIVCEDATGEFRQVGSTCLADFLGHDAYKVARLAEYLAYAAECARGYEHYVGGDMRFIDLEGYLVHVAAMIRLYGWTSGRTAYENSGLRSTRERAWSNMLPNPDDRYFSLDAEPLMDEDKAVAAAAIEWARAFGQKPALSDYEANCLVVANAEMIEPRSAGIAASIVGMFIRERDKGECPHRAARKRLADSRHVGQPGDKLVFETVEVLKGDRIDGEWGASYLYQFRTPEGNVLKWFSTKRQPLTKGDTCSLAGTVKKHSTYNDIQETLVTRCKVAVITAQEAA